MCMDGEKREEKKKGRTRKEDLKSVSFARRRRRRLLHKPVGSRFSKGREGVGVEECERE